MCKKNGTFIEVCKAVSKAIDHRKGFYLQELTNLETGKRSSDRLILKTGEFRKNGVALNVCPFNGEDIRTWDA